MRARSPLAYSLSLLATIVAPCTHATDAIAGCVPLPKILKFEQPLYPPDVEPRGLPSPVSVVVEFIVTPQGRASHVLTVESDAGTYAREFSEQAAQAMATILFDRIQRSCRGRMKIVFKIAD